MDYYRIEHLVLSEKNKSPMLVNRQKNKWAMKKEKTMNQNLVDAFLKHYTNN